MHPDGNSGGPSVKSDRPGARARPGRRRGRYTPLGRQIALCDTVNGARQVWRSVRGSKWGAALERALRYAQHGRRNDGSKLRPIALRDTDSETFRRQLQLVLILVEGRRQKGCRYITCGRDSTMMAMLARRVGACERTVQRDLDTLEEAQLLRRHRPPLSADLPPTMRTKRAYRLVRRDGTLGALVHYSYTVIRWLIDELPAALQRQLARWRSKTSVPDAPQDDAPAGAPMSAAANAAAAAEAMAALQARPPPRPPD